MIIERTRNAKRSIMAGIVYKMITILCPFLIRTLMIKILGGEYLGLNSLFTSVLQVLSLSELGFGGAIVFSMYKPIAEDDGKTICALLNLFRKFYFLVGLTITVIGLLLIPFIPHLITGSYPGNINIYYVYLIYLGNTSVSYFLYGYKSSLLQAHQRNDVESIISSVTTTIMYILQIVVLVLYKNYYLFVIWYPILTITNNIVRALITKKMYPQYFCRGKLSKKKVLEIRSLVAALFGHKVGGIVVNAVDNIVISAFLGLSTVAVYNNYYYIFSAVTGLLSIIYSAMTAGIGNSVIVDTRKKNHNDFKKFTFINAWMVTFCCSCFLCLYQPFMKVWVGKSLMFGFDMVVLLVIYFYILNIRYIVLTYKDACGIWRQDIAKPYVESIVNLMINIILVRVIGIDGVVISTIISLGFIALPWETHVLYKNYFKMSDRHYYILMLRYCISGVAICAATYFVSNFCSFKNDYLTLLFRSVVAVAVSNILFVLLFCKTKEFWQSLHFVKQLLKKHR